MGGNSIPSKQNCFLVEAPKAICEQRGDSRKKEKQVVWHKGDLNLNNKGV